MQHGYYSSRARLVRFFSESFAVNRSAVWAERVRDLFRRSRDSRSAEVALAARGEDPAEFKRRLESLVNTWEPAHALEMGLVMRMACALWRNARFHLMAESVTVRDTSFSL